MLQTCCVENLTNGSTATGRVDRHVGACLHAHRGKNSRSAEAISRAAIAGKPAPASRRRTPVPARPARYRAPVKLAAISRLNGVTRSPMASKPSRSRRAGMLSLV